MQKEDRAGMLWKKSEILQTENLITADYHTDNAHIDFNLEAIAILFLTYFKGSVPMNKSSPKTYSGSSNFTNFQHLP